MIQKSGRILLLRDRNHIRKKGCEFTPFLSFCTECICVSTAFYGTLLECLTSVAFVWAFLSESLAKSKSMLCQQQIFHFFCILKKHSCRRNCMLECRTPYISSFLIVLLLSVSQENFFT